MRKPNSLGRTLRKAGAGPVVHVENRPLNNEEKAALAKREEERQARLARIAERAKNKKG